MSEDRRVAVLGVGMHPWGKWGRNFVEYGVVAAQAALADAGVAWPDIQFVSGADTMRNGYPGYVAGATFAQTLGWNGAQVASSRGLGNIPTTWSVVQTGDYNGDNKSDILWRDSSGNTAIWFMNGLQVASSAGLGNLPIVWAVQGVNAD